MRPCKESKPKHHKVQTLNNITINVIKQIESYKNSVKVLEVIQNLNKKPTFTKLKIILNSKDLEISSSL